MSSLIVSICFLFTLTTHPLFSQEKQAVPDIETIYLHTDRTTYFVGESLWYKAYMVYAYNNLLFGHSNILYVELINSNSEIVTRNKTQMVEGIGNGDFQLSDSLGIKPGNYELRAYSNWNRNFGNDFVFTKNIEVKDVYEGAYGQNKIVKAKPNPANANTTETPDLTVQFFPEGGSLLTNVVNVSAFKATHANGNPVNVKGTVYDQDDTLITMFLSVHNGMGKFQFTPLEGKTYYAEVEAANGKKIKVPLPNPSTSGYTMGCKKTGLEYVMAIKTNPETFGKTPNDSLTLVCNSKGITYFQGTFPLTQKNLSFELPTNNIPEGITQITLYDAQQRPQAERLVYIEKPQNITVKLVSNKPSYQTKEQATLTVTAKDKSGKPVAASFSLSSTDTNGKPDMGQNQSNICSYFLMESQIRGKVFNPGYYFNAQNPKRFEHLDLLLLTQGWRDFIWKTLPENSNTYKTEKGFTISGKVEQLFGEKPKAGASLSLALINASGMSVFSTKNDSLGQFGFNDLLFVGKTKALINSRNEKGKNRGEIILDTLEQPPLDVTFKGVEMGTVALANAHAMAENVYQKYMAFGVTPENVLDEVEIIAKKKDEYKGIYGEPDYSYVPDDKSPTFNDIYALIQFTVPGVMVSNGTVSFMRYNGPAHFLVDGFPVLSQSDIGFIMPDDVAKIDAIKGPKAAIFGSEGANGVIAIYTKTGEINRPTRGAAHSKTEEIEGFYGSRMFYAPDLNISDTDNLDNDTAIRNTIFWTPYVHPDTTGTATVTYFNSAAKATVKVTLEGITQNGIPVVVKTFYEVVK